MMSVVLIEYSDPSGRLYQFIRDKQNMDNGNIAVTMADSSSFKYKSSILGRLSC